MDSENLCIVIMAAGKGTRMKSSLPKVLHKLAGKTMLGHVIDSAKKLSPDKIITIVGHESEKVKSYFKSENIEWVEQKEQLGTGHAIMQIMDNLINYNGNIVILSGDVPLLSDNILKNLVDNHNENNSKATVLTTQLENPFGYGRIIKDDNNNVNKIVEEKDASESEKTVNEINSGTYCFDWVTLANYLKKLTPKNAQGEYYLTDVIQMYVNDNSKVQSFVTKDINAVTGINDRLTLSKMEKIIRRDINRNVMLSGVTLIDPDSTYINCGISIGQDSIIYPNCVIEGDSSIGKNCIIGPNNHISNSKIGNNVKIDSSSIHDSIIRNNISIGPFARLRGNALVKDNCKIGNFVELKNTTFHDGAKSAHLAYLGDSEVGVKANIGAGTITCNYDGKNKHKTVIEENVFVGSNSTLVAPLKLEKDSYIGAGSVITKDVPSLSLSVGRGRQRNIEQWVQKKREKELNDS